MTLNRQNTSLPIYVIRCNSETIKAIQLSISQRILTLDNPVTVERYKGYNKDITEQIEAQN